MDKVRFMEKQDMADALEVCVQNCADDPEFVAEFNRLTGCNFPHGGEPDLCAFVRFVDRYIEGIHGWMTTPLA